MKLVIKLKESPHNFLRRAGYFFEREQNGELAFSRSVGPSRSGYPRFHIYMSHNKVPDETVINLHLDQKRPVYGGVPAHAAEYEGELLEREAERIKQIANK